ncbi:GGDEF domain-containing protein [Methylobacterium persicinum]|uniref:diguanylate cyclase n=1 Tax=Methylobacterium persicinum TaxID=374426 RepID=A0ABU0HFV9_9HYPH|nr:GGDEF domain-containing protein [Methylobacterium persicinum]MDQ0441203.1 diguanylate cyclase (GGDEF)-like protein [Methylobacterium persicinum]GJE35957.1 hypothetical protein KHHGKMAE_0002 [Methylobacterium persicinum]
MAASVRIQYLQWVAGAVAACGCAVLGGMQLTHAFAELNRADRAVAEASRFGLVLAMTDMISAERGPSNAAMDPFAASPEEGARRLAAIRATTDRRIAEVRAASEPGEAAQLASVFDVVGQRLAEARAKVDAVCARPPEERRGAAIADAIRAMFAVADEAALLRSEYGRRLLQSAPEVGAEVLLQAHASALREEAGRLGSYAVMKLTGGVTAEEAQRASRQTEDRIRYLWQLLAPYGRNYADDPDVVRALGEIESEYFATSLPLVRDVFADPTRRGSAADFTRRYVPGLAAPTRLKDGLLSLTLRRIEGFRWAVLTDTLVSAAITAGVLLTLLWLGLVFRRRLFRPLIAVREEILALAVGHLDDPVPVARSGPEIDEMFEGLAILRQELRRKLVLERARHRVTRNLKVLAETDSLTGLRNRRAVSSQAPTMIEAAEKAGQPLGAIVADIDHFKMVNDLHGHAGGDAVLQRVAGSLRSLAGSRDLIARYGGEEFLILAPGLDEVATYALAERMRQRLAMEPGEPAVTGSFGVACRPPGSGLDWEALVAQADGALYRAKRLGRNRVCADMRKVMIAPGPIAQRA